MKLVLKYFGKIIKESPLEEGREYFMGRHEDCDFVLQEEIGLSRNHIKIYQSAETGRWIVESISEWGGLYLEGEEIESVELEESCSLTLKNYMLDFIKEEDQKEDKEKEDGGQERRKENFDLNENLSLKDHTEVHHNEGTKVFSDSDLIYSLYIYIAGEFSDHVNLSEKPIWIIGRSEECDISIDYSILTRKHLQVSKINGKFYVIDMGSSNKTFLNDQELEPKKEVLLRANDEISVADLKIVFEVRNKNYEQMMSHLPALISEDSNELETLPEVALPKVVLEDAPQEEEAISKVKLPNKTRMILLISLIVLGFGLYFQYESTQKKKQKLMEQQTNKEHKDKLEAFYNEALNNLEQGRYQLCIDQLEELHQFSSVGYFKDSQQILMQCQNALESQKHKEEYLAQEKAKKETEAKIKKIADQCKKQFSEKKIQTEEDLDQCAAELLGGLDPANAEISAIRMEITEGAYLKFLAEQKRQAYRQSIQSKKALYNKAKKLRDQNKPLKAVKSYNVFLKSAKGIAPLQELYQQAESERDEVQEKYNDQLNSLHKSCETLIQSKKMKEAYYDCKQILKFKNDDKKARQYVQLAQSSIQKELKPIYEQSMLDESFSRIEEAVQLWNEILEKDIKEGYYYRKALSQIKKYQ